MADITMELAKESFSQWRITRNNQSEPIPEELWGMALGLYPKYKRAHICEQLRLSGSRFKQRLEKRQSSCLHEGFVLASKNTIKATPQQDQEIQLTIQGKERTLTLCVAVHALSQVFPHIRALL
jgi:hypothetical protein